MMDDAADQGAVAVGAVRINYFYLSEDNEPIGPMSLEVLSQLHRGGVVKDETLVALEGAENWTAYSELGSVQDVSKQPVVPRRPSPSPQREAHI